MTDLFLQPLLTVDFAPDTKEFIEDLLDLRNTQIRPDHTLFSYIQESLRHISSLRVRPIKKSDIEPYDPKSILLSRLSDIAGTELCFLLRAMHAYSPLGHGQEIEGKRIYMILNECAKSKNDLRKKKRTSTVKINTHRSMPDLNDLIYRDR